MLCSNRSASIVFYENLMFLVFPSRWSCYNNNFCNKITFDDQVSMHILSVQCICTQSAIAIHLIALHYHLFNSNCAAFPNKHNFIHNIVVQRISARSANIVLRSIGGGASELRILSTVSTSELVRTSLAFVHSGRVFCSSY